MPWLYRVIIGCLRSVVHLYFRQIEVSGLEHIPEDGGGILVAWHPNGMIDPGLVLTQFPRQVIFGARHSLFFIPVLGAVMRQIGTVPIYRAQDAGESADPAARRAANQASLDVLAAQVAKGSFSCLFPEGTSHDAPHPLEIKTGAARFYYQARAQLLKDAPLPVIIPVGLHYDRKSGFRSSAHVVFHAPLTLDSSLDLTPSADEPEETQKARYYRLTDQIEHALHETAHATESWELHYLMRRGRRLIRAERASRAGDVRIEEASLKERTLGFARIRAAYNQRLSESPESVRAIVHRVSEYDADLRALGLKDHELDAPPSLFNGRLIALLLFQAIGLFFFLPPLVMMGYVLNGLPTALLWTISRGAANFKKDESTIKILLAVAFYPLSWAVFSLLAYVFYDMAALAFPWLPAHPIFGALTVFLLSGVSGYFALRYVEWTRELLRAFRVRLTRHRQDVTILRLKVDRAEIFDEMMSMSEGLSLPGEVDSKGRIVQN